MKFYNLRKPIIIFFFIIVIFMRWGLGSVYASAPYNASDVFGQVDENGDGVFTSSEDDNRGNNRSGLYSPKDSVVDEVNHRLFISDTNNDRILVFNLNTENILVDYEADNILGQSVFTSGRKEASASSFFFPRGLAINNAGTMLFVADQGNNRVMVYDITSITNGEDAIYVLGQSALDVGNDTYNDFFSNCHLDIKGLCNPTNVFLDDTSHRLFVSDTVNARVLVFDVTTISNNEDAIYVLGQPDFDTSSRTTTDHGMAYPNEIAFDQSRQLLIIADSGGYYIKYGSTGSPSNARVLIFDVSSGLSNGMSASYVLGEPDFTTQFNDIDQKGFSQFVTGLTYDDARNYLFVADEGRRVLVFDLNTITNNEDAIHVLGQVNFNSSAANISINGLYSPEGLDIDSNNLLYVSDSNNNRVMIFDTNSISDGEDAVNVVGQTDANLNPVFDTQVVSNKQTPNEQGFNGPYTTAFDITHHRLFASDRDNHRVLVFNLNNANELVDRTADYVIGHTDFNSLDSSTTSTGLYGVTGLAYDVVNDRLFVADKDNHRILIYDASPAHLSNGMAASNVLGQTDFDSGNCNQGLSDPTAATLCKPFALSIDVEDQMLYVTDQDNARVLAYNVTPSNITNGMSAVRVFGQSDFESPNCNRSGSAARNTLCAPKGLALDPSTHLLYVGDGRYDGNNRVLVFDITPGVTDNGPDALYVIGQSDFTSTDTGITASTFDNINGVAIDPITKKLYVDDEYNYRVLIFDIEEITNGEDAVFVLGQTDFETASVHNYLATSYSLVYALGATVNPSTHQLFVADTYYHNRFLIFDFAHLDELMSTNVNSGSVISQLLGSGYQGTTTYSLFSGDLPTGVSFNTVTGQFTGIPVIGGNYSFVLSVSDDNGSAGIYTHRRPYSLIINGSSSTQSSPKPDGQYSTTEAPVCNTPKPEGIPTLFQVDRAYTDVTLHFTPTKDNTTYYLISYGVTSDAEGYSVQLDQPTDTSGAISYPIHNLSPHTSYYFKVRNGNNCQPGSWSEIKRDTNSNSYYSSSSLTTQQTLDEVTTDTKKDDKSQSLKDSRFKKSNQENNERKIDAKIHQINENVSSSSVNNLSWYAQFLNWIRTLFHLN